MPHRSTFRGLMMGFGLLLAAAIVSDAVCRAADADAAPARPNIILCMADDQGWGDVGYNGHPVLKTPVLDEMAAAGLRLDRFYAAAPVCSPTRGSVLTGRHPNRFGCFSWGHTLRPQEVTVAEALRSAGYTTGHFGKWHLGPVRADSPVSPGRSGFDEWLSSPNFYENDPLMSHNGRVIQTHGESSQVAVDAALRFIRAASERRQPFLAVIWFGNPHSPHIARPELRDLYKDQPAALQNYYGEITGIDRAMGQLRHGLRDLKIADNTLLWYTSDNGPQGPEGRPGSTGGLSGRKASLWEGGIRVPAILEWPARIRAPRRMDLPCGSVDIYPTLLEIAGARVPHQPPLDGISLVSLIDGQLTARPKPLGFWVYPAAGLPMRSTELLRELAAEQASGQPADDAAPAAENKAARNAKPYPATERPGHAAWIDGDWKLHRIPAKGGTFRDALFNLKTDPQEKTDLARDEPQRVERMQQELERWQTSVIASLNGDDYVAAADDGSPREIGSRRELFVDDYLIDSLRGGARLHLHQPQPREVVLVTDKPWEGNTCVYYTIFQDGPLYRMYYRGAHFDEKTRRAAHREVTCYAESRDGIHWTKPDLGLFAFDGSKQNNIVWDGIGTHNFTPFRDENPACSPQARYKALARGKGGLYAFGSPDAIHWSLLAETPVITKGAFDSQNLAFWDAQAGCYREYHRAFRGVRDIMTGTSNDFLHWTDPEFLTYPGAPQEHLYTNAVQPYERAAHLLIGFPARYLPATQQVEPLFMSSRDGRTFQRRPEAVIPLTAPAERDGNRSNYIAWGLVRLPGHNDEYSIYASESYYTGPDSRLRRFTYRPDGFVSVRADAGGGELVTRPLRFAGEQLVLNLTTAPQGQVRVELQDAAGRPLPGFTLDDCPPLRGDSLEQTVTWTAGSDLSRLAGQPIRVRFVLHDADLYALQFQPSR